MSTSTDARGTSPRSAMPDPGSPAAALGVPPTLRSMLDLLAETIVAALGFGVAAINMVRPDGRLEVISVAGDTGARELLLGTSESAETWAQLLAQAEPWGRLRFEDHAHLVLPDMLAWTSERRPIDASDAWHPQDALFAPLTSADGDLLGVISVDLPEDGRRPGETVRRALEGFAVSAALAIEQATVRAQAEESADELRRQVVRDALTGLGTRALLLDRLGHALAERPAERATLAVAFIDLDRFKQVNDEFSHDVGDHVLVTVADRLRSTVRPHDTVARWGGDEFVVLLEHLHDRADGLGAVARLDQRLREPIRHGGHDLGVGVSIGVAFLDPHDPTPAEGQVAHLVQRADEAMYAAKRAGGGCEIAGGA